MSFLNLFKKQSTPPAGAASFDGAGRIPFPAYKGNEPYIFISYAHADAQAVYREITKFHQQGYCVWYDEGISPGNEWTDEIAEALAKCALFVVFFTPKSAASLNVQNEINFAIDEKIPFLAIHLETTNLSPGIKLRVGTRQAILKYNMSEEEYDYKYTTAFERLGLKRGKKQVVSTPPNPQTESKALEPLVVKESKPMVTQTSTTTKNQETTVSSISAAKDKSIPQSSNAAIYNASNGGMMLEHDGWIYYIKDNSIFKISSDGNLSTRTTLYSTYNDFGNLNIRGETIYFYLTETGICKINTDGSNFSVITGVFPEANPYRCPEGMILIDEYLFVYFDNPWPLYRVSLDGSQIQMIISKNCSGITAYNGKVYFCFRDEFNGGTIDSINPDGSGRQTFIEDLHACITLNFLLDDDYVYYFAYDNASFYRVRHDGTGKEKISIDRGNHHFTMDDTWVYYNYGWGVMDKDSRKMYRYKKDGSVNEEMPLNNIDDEYGFYMINGKLFVSSNRMLRKLEDDGVTFEKAKI